MFAVVVSVLLVTPGWALDAPETSVDPVLEVRARALRETEAGESPVGALQERARLGLEVARLGVSARATLQVARGWRGSDTFVVAAFTPELAEGWVRVEGGVSGSVGAELTIGRQIVEIHEGRIIGADDFSLRGRSLEALRLRLDLSPLQLELINARRWAEDDPLGLGVTAARIGLGRDEVHTVWQVDGLLLVDGRNTRTPTTTAGSYARVEVGRSRSRAELYVQVGERFASLGSAQIGWGFGADEQLVVRGAVDRSSGDSSDTVAFAPVLGDTRPFWGIVEAFDSPEGSDRRGLTDVSIGAEWRVSRPLQIEASLHRFWATEGGGALGLEADVEARWWVSPMAAFGAGYGHLWTGQEYGGPSRGFGYGEIDARF